MHHQHQFSLPLIPTRAGSETAMTRDARVDWAAGPPQVLPLRPLVVPALEHRPPVGEHLRLQILALALLHSGQIVVHAERKGLYAETVDFDRCVLSLSLFLSFDGLGDDDPEWLEILERDELNAGRWLGEGGKGEPRTLRWGDWGERGCWSRGRSGCGRCRADLGVLTWATRGRLLGCGGRGLHRRRAFKGLGLCARRDALRWWISGDV